jgi:hypothetical protein
MRGRLRRVIGCDDRNVSLASPPPDITKWWRQKYDQQVANIRDIRHLAARRLRRHPKATSEIMSLAVPHIVNSAQQRTPADDHKYGHH